MFGFRGCERCLCKEKVRVVTRMGKISFDKTEIHFKMYSHHFESSHEFQFFAPCQVPQTKSLVAHGMFAAKQNTRF